MKANTKLKAILILFILSLSVTSNPLMTLDGYFPWGTETGYRAIPYSTTTKVTNSETIAAW